MKKVYKLLALAFFTALTTTFNGCKKDADIVEVPTIATSDVHSVMQTGASAGGYIPYKFDGVISSKGITWSTEPEWDIYSNRENMFHNGSGAGSFEGWMENLKPGTVYYFRAYAVFGLNVVLGPVKHFVTLRDEIVYQDASYDSVVDIEGHVYKTIQVGGQVWMAQNLRVTRFNDGTPIPGVNNSEEWKNLQSPGYCWYDNNEAGSAEKFGALYNWYAATNSSNLCPTGWHVPNFAEVLALSDYLGGYKVAGGQLKEASLAHWLPPNTGANNNSGLTVLPGGGRSFDGSYGGIQSFGFWWTSTRGDDGYGLPVSFSTSSDKASILFNDYSNSEKEGYSIRCIKN